MRFMGMEVNMNFPPLKEVKSYWGMDIDMNYRFRKVLKSYWCE
jgi:hypothetical protein